MINITKHLRYALLLLLAAGCATPYQKDSKLNFLTPGGFKDERISDSTYRITFIGNGNTSDEKVGRYMLFRCAELAREHGFRYFVFVPSEITGGLSMDMKPWPSNINRSMMTKARYTGGVIFFPGGWAGVIRSKAVTIHMLQDPKKVPFRMMGWEVKDVFAALEPYVRSSGDQPGHVPPAYAFDPNLGLVSYRGVFDGDESSGASLSPTPARHDEYNGTVQMDTLDGLLPEANHAP